MISETMMVTGQATLHVEGNVSIGGTAKIVVGPTGSLTLYVGATTGTNTTAGIGGRGIVNQTGRALGCRYYGLPGNISVMLSTKDFVGTIYAPNADLTLNAGGAVTHHFSGASVSKSLVISGHFHVHYDENLAPSGPLF